MEAASEPSRCATCGLIQAGCNSVRKGQLQLAVQSVLEAAAVFCSGATTAASSCKNSCISPLQWPVAVTDDQARHP